MRKTSQTLQLAEAIIAETNALGQF